MPHATRWSRIPLAARGRRAKESELELIRGSGGGGAGLRRGGPRVAATGRQHHPYNYVYSPTVDPTSEQFDTEDDPRFTGEPTTMVDLLNGCMRDEMTARFAHPALRRGTWPTPPGTTA